MRKTFLGVMTVAMLMGALVPANAHVQKQADAAGDTGYAPLDIRAASFKETKKDFTVTMTLDAPLPPASAVPEGNAYLFMGWGWGFDFNDDIFYDIYLYSDGSKWHAAATRYDWPDGQEVPDYSEVPAKVSNESNKVFKVTVLRKHVAEAKKGDTVLWTAYTGYGQGDDAEGLCYDEWMAPAESAPAFRSLAQEEGPEEPEEPTGSYGCWDYAPDHESAKHRLKK